MHYYVLVALANCKEALGVVGKPYRSFEDALKKAGHLEVNDKINIIAFPKGVEGLFRVPGGQGVWFISPSSIVNMCTPLRYASALTGARWFIQLAILFAIQAAHRESNGGSCKNINRYEEYDKAHRATNEIEMDGAHAST